MNRTLSVADEISLRMAEEIAKTWRSIDESPRRAQHKAKIQIAIGKAIVDALIATTAEEMGQAPGRCPDCGYPPPEPGITLRRCKCEETPMTGNTIKPSEVALSAHQPTELQQRCRELCGESNGGYHDPECPILKLVAPSREQRLEDALRKILSLFNEEPKMYLRPCDPNHRMTYGDSDRVDEAFIAAEKALEGTNEG